MKDFILEFSQPGSKISKKRGSLVVSNAEFESKTLIPFSDIQGVLIVNSQCNISTGAVLELLKHDVCIQFLDEKFMPVGLLTPFVGSHRFKERFSSQLSCTLPQKKRLWQRIVIQKIKNQKKVLKHLGKDTRLLNKFVSEVSINDQENHEAQAARFYWKNLLGSGFKRRVDGFGVNAFLNYGYSIIRSSVARYIVASGLQPSLGVFHKNLENPFCLVDDLMEPFRPLVDFYAYEFQNENEFTPEFKKKMVSILEHKVVYSNEEKPLRNAIKEYCYSFLKSLIEKDYKVFDVNVDFTL